MLAATKRLSRQNIFVATKLAISILLSQQKTCFVVTKVSLSRQKNMFGARILLSLQKTFFVATKVLSRLKWYFWQLLPMIPPLPPRPCSPAFTLRVDVSLCATGHSTNDSVHQQNPFYLSDAHRDNKDFRCQSLISRKWDEASFSLLLTFVVWLSLFVLFTSLSWGICPSWGE